MAGPFRQRRLTKIAKKKAKKAAKHLPSHMQDAAFSYASNKTQPNLGTFGPAGPVRHIDPKEYKDG